jgi:hypothetical protein
MKHHPKQYGLTFLLAAVLLGLGFSIAALPAGFGASSGAGASAQGCAGNSCSATSSGSGPHRALSCTGYDASVADPSAPHGLFVANVNAFAVSEQEVLQYILPDPTVCGANILVPWSAIDRGPGANPQYDFSFINDAVQPWVAAGKVVNLIVQGVPEKASPTSPFSQSTPSYVMSQVDTVISCGPNVPVTPVYWEPGYIDNYEAFMRALVSQYQSAPWLGYIRFGIGSGGEDFPEVGYAQGACLKAWRAAGLTPQQWQDYSVQVIGFEQSLGSSKLLLAGLNDVGGNAEPEAVAAAAAANGMGFGIQGLTIRAEQAYNAGQPCYANWCNLFNQYAGQAPLEVQTYSRSDPSGAGIGSLADLLPFALERHAQIFELYPQEWLVANDPSYPGYAQYHLAYQQALESAAAVVGFAPR